MSESIETAEEEQTQPVARAPQDECAEHVEDDDDGGLGYSDDEPGELNVDYSDEPTERGV